MAEPIKIKIPAPRTGNWKEKYGSWENFMKEVRKSIGRDLGHGVLKLSVDKDE